LRILTSDDADRASRFARAWPGTAMRDSAGSAHTVATAERTGPA